MSVDGAAMVDAATMSELLDGVRAGSSEVLGALDAQPLLVVDLDTPGPRGALRLPTALPCVVVGISRAGRLDSDGTPGVDVALATAVEPAAPWVAVTDADRAVGEIADAVRASPQASVALAQVLRSGGTSLEHDLHLESLTYSTLQAGSEFRSWQASNASSGHTSSGHASGGAADEEVLRVNRRGPRLTLVLNRPRVRNAYSSALRDQLCEALTVACADASITEVHLLGAGRDFCSGGDLGEFGTLTDPATAHLVRSTRSAARLLGVIGERVVAHLHGGCVGAGIELPALAGTVMATPDTRVRLPEVAMGLIPGAGGTATLPRRIGRHRTAWMALTGTGVDAGTALQWGLVDEIVSTEPETGL